MVRFLLPGFVFLCIFLTQCKKETSQVNLTVEGNIIRSTNQEKIQGIQLTFSEQVLDGGVASGAFNVVGEATTGEDGYYSFTYERKNALEYRINAEHSHYFNQQVSINPDNLSPDHPLSKDIYLRPKAWLQIRMINQYPETEEDEVVYENLDANFDCNCCTNQSIVKTGTDVDTTFTCTLVGDSDIHFRFVTEKLSFDTDSVVIDSVSCPAFDTTLVNIDY